MGCGASSGNAVEQENVTDRQRDSDVEDSDRDKPAPKHLPVATKTGQLVTREDSELEVLSTKTHSMSVALATGAHTGSLHDNYVLGKTLGASPSPAGMLSLSPFCGISRTRGTPLADWKKCVSGTGGYAQVKCGVHIATQKKASVVPHVPARLDAAVSAAQHPLRARSSC